MNKNIVIFGPPGSGKGTQSKFISKFFKMIHLSTGDIFRKNILNKTKLGIIAKSYLNKGLLVPDNITIDMISNQIKVKKSILNGFIYDGYPRTLNQTISLNEFLNKNFLGKINIAFFLSIKDDIIIKRISKRSKISGRLDDMNLDILSNRIKEYHIKNKEVLNFYQKQGCLIKIDAEKDIQLVKSNIKEYIQNIIFS